MSGPDDTQRSSPTEPAQRATNRAAGTEATNTKNANVANVAGSQRSGRKTNAKTNAADADARRVARTLVNSLLLQRMKTAAGVSLEWVECFDAEFGCNYYFNIATGDSSWDEPPGVVPIKAVELSEFKAVIQLQTRWRGRYSTVVQCALRR